MDPAQAGAAAAAASAVSAYAVKGAAARGKGAVAARAAAMAARGTGGGRGAKAEGEEGDGGEGGEGGEEEEEEEEDSLPPPLCAALAQLQRGGEPPRVICLSNCGLRDVHLLPLLEALQGTLGLETLDLSFNRLSDAGVHGQSDFVPLDSAPARLLHLLRARLVALCSLALPG